VRNPFIAGSWVRADNFFGRTDMLREVLEGERDSLWAVGARRLGKTSLLKELEYRVQQAGDTPFVPLYWDLQGSADARGLADGLLGSVEDGEAFRRATSIAAEDLDGLSAAEMLTTLVRRTVRSGSFGETGFRASNSSTIWPPPSAAVVVVLRTRWLSSIRLSGRIDGPILLENGSFTS